MPIKSTATAVALPKKIIYINWNEQEVLTEEEFNDTVREKLDELMEDAYALGDFVSDHYDCTEIGRALMTATFREAVLEHYKEWCYNQVTDDMDGIEKFEV